MALQIQGVPPFNPNGDQTSLSQRWTKCVKSFNYFITASGINNDERKHALLLHMVGPATQEIYETLGVNDQNENKLDTALAALNNHFKAKKNVPFERSVFRNANQNTGETTDQYVTRLRQLAQHCEYGNETDNNIRDQVISSCRSSKLRKRLLTELDLTLDKTLQIARMIEDVNHFTKTIENNNNVAESLNKMTFQNRNHHKQGYRGNLHQGNQRRLANRSIYKNC